MTALSLTGARQLRLPHPLALAVVGLLILSACDESSGVRRGIDTLGDDFVRAFNQDPNDEPLDASELDLTLTPTIEPFDP